MFQIGIFLIKCSSLDKDISIQVDNILRSYFNQDFQPLPLLPISSCVIPIY